MFSLIFVTPRTISQTFVFPPFFFHSLRPSMKPTIKVGFTDQLPKLGLQNFNPLFWRLFTDAWIVRGLYLLFFYAYHNYYRNVCGWWIKNVKLIQVMHQQTIKYREFGFTVQALRFSSVNATLTPNIELHGACVSGRGSTSVPGHHQQPFTLGQAAPQHV